MIGDGPMWPVELRDSSAAVVLRPLRRGDESAWREVRQFNRDWLRPWDATLPVPGQRPPSFKAMVKMYDKQARRGQSVPFAIEVGGVFRGQITVSGITWGSILSGQIGYWIDSRVAGRGITPLAVAMVTDHCLLSLGLHRVEINIRPENAASLRVVEKLGFRDEGVRKSYMHIDGRWTDHRTFALTLDDVPHGILSAYRHGTGGGGVPRGVEDGGTVGPGGSVRPDGRVAPDDRVGPDLTQ